MMKLIKMTLVSAVLATSGFAMTILQYGKTITLSTETVTDSSGVTTTEAGEFEITATKTLEMQGTDANAATIAMNPGTTLTVAGKITVKDGCTGQIENTDPEDTNKPTIEIASQFVEALTDVTKDADAIDAAYKAIIGTDTETWTVYEAKEGYIDSKITYKDSKDSFNITRPELEIVTSNGESTNIYDLNKNGGSTKVAVNTDDIAKPFGQHFCTTGTEGYPELTLNAVPYSSANLSQMTEGKVIIKFDYDTLETNKKQWPNCDLDLAINTSDNVKKLNLTGDGMEVPAGKTWEVTGNAPVHIQANINVKGKLVL